ncbi:hypothetical protein [Haliangium sp.]|uniref:hypothetical protein n=1 Tax=Haliangium sp. TaxID=2663208 RepID=UPI003D149B53
MNKRAAPFVLALSSLTSTLVAGVGPVHAQEAAEAPAPGGLTVDTEARARAATLFAEGSAAFENFRFVQAEGKYRESLEHWEHVVTYLYLSRTLDQQMRPVESYRALQQALARGREALPTEEREQADALAVKLRGQLAELEARCDEPGAQVLLDGEPWFVGPGQRRQVVRPGQHVIISSKDGHYRVTEAIALLPGRTTKVELRMSVDEVRTVRRWQPWLPWATAGLGATGTATGVLLRSLAARNLSTFRQELSSCERAPSCPQVDTAPRGRGVVQERVAAVSIIGGSAVLVAGLAGVLLNLPRLERSEDRGGVQLELLPEMSPSSAGISALLRF